MTPTITLPRATVEQALEALVWEAGSEPALYAAQTYKAIADLRAALAQQAEPVEPVAHRVVAGALFDFMGWLTSRRERLVLSSIDDAAPAADAIKDFAEMRGLSLDDAKVRDWNAALAQQAEPVEPVARVVEHGATVRLEWVSADAAHNAKVGPLFSMLPQRQPLTDEEIDALPWNGSPRQLARAVERALEEKNCGR